MKLPVFYCRISRGNAMNLRLNSRLPNSRAPLTRRKFLQYGLLGAALSQGLSSCGWRLADIRNQTAAPEGKPDAFYAYTWTSYTNDDLLKEFQQQTGVRHVAEIMPSNEEMLATFQAGKGQIYSLIFPSDYTVETMQEKGYLQVLEADRLENLDTLLPSLAQTGLINGQRYCVPLTWGTTGLLYNSQKITNPLTDWEYLWQNKEQLTRRMTLLEDAREVFGAVLHTLGHSQNTSDLGQIKQAYEKLQQLKPYIANFTTDAWRDPLLAGDLWVCMAYSTDATDLMKENPDLKYVLPTSGTNLWGDTMVIPVTAPSKDMAYDWINSVMAPEKAAQLSQTLGYVPSTQAAIDLLPEEVKRDPVKFPPPEALSRCETMKILSPEATAAVDQYWNQLKT
jgi:spermidine/putrescine transport system substrate-binding protein